MAQNSKTIILFFIQILACSIGGCQESDFNDELKRAESIFLNSFKSDSLFCHFPSSINNANVISGFISPPRSNNCFGEANLVLRYNEDFRSSVANQKYVMIDSFSSKSFFILRYDFVTDSLYNRKHTSDTCFKYPVADLHQSDFKLGEIPDTTYFVDNDRYLVIPKYKVPDDLKLYIIQSKPGNFWKTSCSVYRSPFLTRKWKNGYSRGYAISEKQNIIVFWVVTW